MTKAMLAALAVCCTTALATCPESKGQAEVTKVSNETKSECVLSCDGTGAAVQTVANETKGDCAKVCDEAAKADCAKACDGTGAAVQKVSNEAKSDCAKSCDSGAAVQTVSNEAKGDCAKACPLEKAMPVMLMKVGNETTACSESAKQMCEKSGAAMTYIVMGKEYDCSVEAKTAQQAAMVEMLDAMTHVSFNVGGEHTECPVGAQVACKTKGEAMKYQVGPMVFDNAEDAVRAAAMARAAIAQVAMTYEVEGKTTKCSAEAKEMAAGCESSSMTYVVNGKKTSCSKSAEFNLTEAKLLAAIDGVRKSVSQG